MLGQRHGWDRTGTDRGSSARGVNRSRFVMADIGTLRDQIAAGTYRLDAASIAGALLAHAGLEAPSAPSVPQPPCREPERGTGTRRRAAGG